MLQGCANAGEVKSDTQKPATKAATKPAEGWSGDNTPTAVAKPAAVASAGAQTAAPVAASADKLPTQYKVVAGDTLAKVAARKEIYDNAAWWPLLYRNNSQIIGPQGLIYPGQVLAVPRNHSSAEIDAMLNRPHKPSKVAVKPQAKPAPVATAAVKPKTTAAAPVKPEAADATAPAVATVPVSLVSAARRAFSAGDIPWAEYYYNVHLTQHSRDVRAWGELGNVYYFDGELPESAQAYYNAANIMLDQGRVGAAVQLLPAIDEGNPELAQALYDRLSSIQ
jgi:LysM repeat protein